MLCVSRVLYQLLRGKDARVAPGGEGRGGEKEGRGEGGEREGKGG